MAATAPKLTKRSNSLKVLNYNFSKEQCMLPEDDCVIETCRSILRVGVCNEIGNVSSFVI